MSINKAIILGNVGKDPQVRTLGDAARRQVAEYYRSISRRLEECTYDYKGAECYDSFRRSANDVARIVMKMADKGKEEGVLARIEEFIDSFEAQGRFTEDDYKRFILR